MIAAKKVERSLTDFYIIATIAEIELKSISAFVVAAIAGEGFMIATIAELFFSAIQAITIMVSKQMAMQSLLSRLWSLL